MIDLSNITRLLDSNRLKEALTELDFLSSTTQDWSLRDDLEELQTSYNYMLLYMKQGVADPNRKELYRKLLQKAYKLRDRLQRASSIRVDKSYYFETVRSKLKSPGRSFSEILQLLELQSAPAYTDPKELLKQHDSALVELFEKTWILSSWSETDAEELNRFLVSIHLLETDLPLLVSAVTMSILRDFDARKLAFLHKAYNHASIIVSQRALVGIAITAVYHDQRICQDPETLSLMHHLSSHPEFMNELQAVQIQFLLTRETQKIDKKMREEIIPTMKKVAEQRKEHLKFDDVEEFDENNPEWGQFLSDSRIEKQMREIGELQMSGADVFMSSFAQLKHYPFFYVMAHWFFEFDPSLVDLSKISMGSGQRVSFFDLLLHSPVFCNSDKFSFYFTLTGFDVGQQELITQELNMQQEQLTEGQPGLLSGLLNRELKPEELSRQYIHDLYRFFKLWRNRSEELDIFQSPFHLWECECLRMNYSEANYLKEIADYFLKNDYPAEAVAIYDQLTQNDHTDVEYWQKAGFACQKMGEYKRAVQYYLQADLIQSDSLWLNRKLAQCFRKLGDWENALDYYRKVEVFEQDNLSITQQIGHCLVELHSYEEALPYFYKVEYYGKNSINAQRAIGWCSFVLARYDEAVRQFEKVLQFEDKSNYHDWLNAGHAYYAQGNVDRAVSCYGKAQEKCADRELFVNLFYADAKTLLAHNFSEEDVFLLLDELI
ncbi:MAG: tetratricopeptide repeat protein [Phocaeicola sp.]